MSNIRFLTRIVLGVPDYAAAGATRPTGNGGVPVTGLKKFLVLLGALLLTGCGSMPSLEQLEDQAFLSGDWSAVEKREKQIARRAAIRGPQCPARMIAVCEKRGAQNRCGCVEKTAIRELLASLRRP